MQSHSKQSDPPVQKSPNSFPPPWHQQIKWKLPPRKYRLMNALPEKDPFSVSPSLQFSVSIAAGTPPTIENLKWKNNPTTTFTQTTLTKTTFLQKIFYPTGYHFTLRKNALQPPFSRFPPSPLFWSQNKKYFTKILQVENSPNKSWSQNKKYFTSACWSAISHLL